MGSIPITSSTGRADGPDVGRLRKGASPRESAAGRVPPRSRAVTAAHDVPGEPARNFPNDPLGTA